MTDLAKLVVKLEAETSRYQKELDSAKRKLAAFDKDIGDTVKKIAVGVGTAALAAAAGLATLVKHTIDSADHLNDLSKRTGVSVEDLSKLSFAAKQSGVDLEGLAGGLRKFNNAIAEAAGNAKSDAAVAFRAMGVELKDINGNLKPTNELLSQVATKFATYRDGANKGAIATALFGKTGTELIPLLNEGAEGLARMGDQAQKAGAVISGDTARAADEFNDKLGQLKLTLIDGFGNQLTAKLLPSLNALGAQWDADKNRVDTLNAVIGVLAGLLKGIAAIAIVVTGIFQQAGQAIYSINAAVFDFLKLDFRGGVAELKDGLSSLVGNAESDVKKLKALFSDSPFTPEGQKKMGIGSHQASHSSSLWQAPDAPSISAMKAGNAELDKAAAARQRLLEMDQNLKEQAATFDLTDAAATRYRLTLGSLSDDVKKAGAGGLALRDAIIADAEAFDRLKTTKEVSDALKDVNAQIAEFKGNTVEAELARFDKANEELVKKLRTEGNEAGQAQLATLRQLIGAQAQYNALQSQAEKIQSDLVIAEERIENSRNVGALTELEALKQTSAARAGARDDLQAIYEQQKKISQETGNPAQVEGVKRFGAAIQTLGSQVDLLGQRARASLETGLGTFFEDTLKNVHNLGEAFGNFLNDLAGQLVKFAAQNFAQKLLGSIFPSGGGGGNSILSSIGALFGGGRAGGGPVQEGMAYKVNENTPRSEWFVPSSRGHVVPASGMGGVSVTQNFSIQAPQGTISRATQLQLGNEAARGLAQAQRRNG